MATVVPAAARFKLVFNVPPSALEACKTAIFAAGAGRYPGPGSYTECCWTVIGTEVQEARVETVYLGEDVARKAVEALKIVRPYEEPSYEVYKLEDF